MDLERALKELRVGDIVLMRYHRGAIYRAIREIDRSHWNHAALVFDVLDDGQGHRTILVIEAMPGGIEVHRLKRYLDDPKRYEIGFKRMPILDDQSRSRFLGFFLDVLGTPYDFTRLAAFLLRKYILRFGGAKAQEYLAKRAVNTDQFICTSFAQRAYYLAVPPELREKTLFRRDRSLDFLTRMEQITPGDIARSPNTEWLYNPHS